MSLKWRIYILGFAKQTAAHSNDHTQQVLQEPMCVCLREVLGHHSISKIDVRYMHCQEPPTTIYIKI